MLQGCSEITLIHPTTYAYQNVDELPNSAIAAELRLTRSLDDSLQWGLVMAIILRANQHAEATCITCIGFFFLSHRSFNYGIGQRFLLPLLFNA